MKLKEEYIGVTFQARTSYALYMCLLFVKFFPTRAIGHIVQLHELMDFTDLTLFDENLF